MASELVIIHSNVQCSSTENTGIHDIAIQCIASQDGAFVMLTMYAHMMASIHTRF